MYNGLMIKFTTTEDGYIFLQNSTEVAIGSYSTGNFHLIFGDDVLTFSNAMQAYTHLRSTLEPSIVSAETLRLINTPARAIDNLSKYKYNSALEHVTKEVFYATVPC